MAIFLFPSKSTFFPFCDVTTAANDSDITKTIAMRQRQPAAVVQVNILSFIVIVITLPNTPFRQFDPLYLVFLLPSALLFEKFHFSLMLRII